MRTDIDGRDGRTDGADGTGRDGTDGRTEERGWGAVDGTDGRTDGTGRGRTDGSGRTEKLQSGTDSGWTDGTLTDGRTGCQTDGTDARTAPDGRDGTDGPHEVVFFLKFGTNCLHDLTGAVGRDGTDCRTDGRDVGINGRTTVCWKLLNKKHVCFGNSLTFQAIVSQWSKIHFGLFEMLSSSKFVAAGFRSSSEAKLVQQMSTVTDGHGQGTESNAQNGHVPVDATGRIRRTGFGTDLDGIVVRDGRSSWVFRTRLDS